ncbi:hypothetical protein [Streptomyces sp. NPDC001843]|uniref:hypothetical protein n=1 Tax=Streptomyces sp. NPDC001843 TaxID=3364617 RepID=UPI00367BCD75
MTTWDADVDRLFWAGEAARQAGRSEDALAAHRRAEDVLRDRLARDPADTAAHEKLAALLYSVGASLVSVGQPEVAAAVLDDSEAHYRRSTAAGRDLLVADVQARRARAQADAGRPVSALTDIDLALEGYARQGVHLAGPPHSLDLARVLSQAAVVHRTHGDVDQALACAAQALARFREAEGAANADPAGHLGYAVDMAADTASALEAARGNWPAALGVDDFVLNAAEQGWGDLAGALARKGVHLRAAGRTAEAEQFLVRASGMSPTAVEREERILAAPLPRSLDEALRTAGAATGLVGVAVLRRMLTTEESYSVSGRMRDRASAPLHARRLADLAAAVDPRTDTDAAWRMALESHLLHHTLFRNRAEGSAAWLDAHGDAWATALRTMVRAVGEQYGSERAGDDVRAAVDRLDTLRTER